MSTSESENRSAPPLFLFGLERSGTTLLSMMVGAHPEIAVPLTVTGLWYRYAGRIERYGPLERRESLERLVDDLMEEERIRLWDVEMNRDDILREPIPRSFAAVVERFHACYARKKDKPGWANLDIATLDEMDVANGWFPYARFLHIVRDGRDVALSHETMPYGASNTLEAAESWKHRLGANLKMGAILGPERYLVIRYEDLVLDSEATLRRICRFAGVAYAPDMLDYPRMVDEKIPQDRRWLWPALDKPPDRSKVGIWRTRMSVTKRIVFEGAARSMLERLGYEVYETVPKSVTAYAYELWCFLGRGGRFRRALARWKLKRPSRLQQSYRSIQEDSFGSLVREGTYRADFQHPPRLRAFFESCLGEARARLQGNGSLRVLDCGCGPGAWLDVVHQTLAPRREVDLYGFDLTPEMIEVARRRLKGRVHSEHVRRGDILSPDSYVFDGAGRTYQIVYAFDVVQQLPRRRQLDAVRVMMEHVDPGGCAVVFDHDRWSRYGLEMGFRKLVTRYLRVPLVPRYYCNARYPALARFAARIAATGPYETEVKVAPDGRKRALFVWRPPAVG